MGTSTSTADGATLHWDELGSRRHPTLVLLTGQALDGRIWARTLPELVARFHIIVPYYRGMRRSSASFPAAWTTRDLAADIATVIEAAGVRPAAVWGFSMGGRAAQWLAADRPELVPRLVLSSTTPGDRLGVRRPVWVTRALFAGEDHLIATLFFTEAFVAQNPQWVSAATPSTRVTETLRAHHIASRDHDATDALPKITARTLITHGGADLVTPPENGAILARNIPGARLRITPQGRHGAHLQFPTTTSAVQRFLRED